MADGIPLVQAGPGYAQSATALAGTAKDVDLVVRQTGVALTLVASDTVIDGSTYLWEKTLLPTGRMVYLEAIGSGINVAAIVTVTVSLYTVAGVLVPNSTLTISSLTPQRLRTTLALALTDNTEYLVKYKTSGLAGTAYLYFVRLVIR